MEIEFDPEKDKTNKIKHDVSLSEAANIDWETLWAKEDARQHYDEVRMIGYAYIGLRLFCVVYTDRADTRRVISLRKANKRELNRYAKA